uniref:Uncharacterized protein n=1 Tax=Acrobeloides nanus TaxID=290746 RepID=A0A914EG36_9BILA
MLHSGSASLAGIGNQFDGFLSLYSHCCDSSFYWVNLSTNSEYFPFIFYEPYFHFGKQCIVLAIDGGNPFEIQRNGYIMAEYCEFPHLGTICKKKSDKPFKPINNGQVSTNISLQTIQDFYRNSHTIYSRNYRSTINPIC